MENIEVIKKIERYNDYTSITFECGLTMNTQNSYFEFVEGETVIFQSGRNRGASYIFKFSPKENKKQ